MTEWFEPEAGRWFALFSLLSLLAATAPWIAKGQFKTLVTSLFVAALAIGCVLIGLGIYARATGQPTHVVGSLQTAGFVITIIFGVMIGVVRSGYAKAEQLKIIARDM